MNEYRVRIVALFVFVASASFLLTGAWIIPALLSVDFALRSFGKGRYSPLNIAAGWIVSALSIGNKPIDQAPKLFAAQLGFAFAVFLLIATWLQLTGIGYALAGILILFSFLESAFGFCAGCHVYSLVKKIFPTPGLK
jgi:hypothetical protein